MPDEKFDEKAMEKREEKTPEEKSWDEKWRRDPLGSAVWALVFIWAGLVLLANNLGMLRQIREQVPFLEGLDPLALILLGAGLLVVMEIVVRLLVPTYRRPVGGSLILAIILISIALGSMTTWNLTWPLILIALGILVLFRGLFRRDL